ncbi:predicted protein [Uncinocarpus reesii 1704]|uniref:Uncharacterized protein n=1 Tax=Uncinocarpus reesii (strain UAMH 1704) TaxID=336963 RepID=C4JM09_UNCRE|nr:uncharacterized protein UREG_03867 [Uncinocarpus reesii 1704]EEP79021.1 predicted protein [Uncinocarpus reesii 1704]
MLASTGARRSGNIAGAARSTLQQSLRSHRQFSSLTTSRNPQSQWRSVLKNNSTFRAKNHGRTHSSLLYSHGYLSSSAAVTPDVTPETPTPISSLPLVTGGSVYLAIKRGGEMGMDIKNSPLGKFMLVGMPLISTVAMLFWPAVLQLYFASTGILALVQSYLTTSPGFRKFARLEPLPKPEPQDPNTTGIPSRIRVIPTTARAVPDAQQEPEQQVYPAQKISVIDRALDNVKTGVRDMQKQVKEKMDEMSGNKEETNPDGTPKVSRLSKQELENAAAYEKRRKEQIEMERELRNQRLRQQYTMKNGDQNGK